MREGLPPSYRMRHDPHYVDQIASRRHAEPVHLVPIGHIDGPHPVHAPRDLQALVESIRSVGLLQPLLVRRQNGRFQLIAGARRLAAALAAGLTEVPCLVHTADDERARALAAAEAISTHGSDGADRDAERADAIPSPVFSEIAERLDAIGSCLQLFGERERPLRERVAIDLIQAEVQRAGWLSQALAVLAEEPAMTSNPVQLGPLVERLLEASMPERALSAVEFDLVPCPSACTVQGDEQFLALALMAMLSAVHALVERVPDARVTVRLSLDAAHKQAAVSVAQSMVTLPAAWRTRFFDLSWRERPGGASVGAALLAARRVAALHGGQLVLTSADRQGATLTMTVPTV